LGMLQAHTVYSRGIPPAQALLTGSSELHPEGVLPLCAAMQQLVATLREVRNRLALTVCACLI
jgi:hypothetical protein